ncbi:MAG: aminoglycoside phosphotransferase family protein [Burkholderiaceae bacterium]
MTESDNRLETMKQWLAGLPLAEPCELASLRSASSDASFRRYFRVNAGLRTLIVMDAPPPQEDCRPFIHAAQVLDAAGVTVPAVLFQDLERGFLLLSDLGDTTMLARINTQPEQADPLYRAACAQLITLQQPSRPGVFADYDEATQMTELRLFDQWYLQQHLTASLTETEQQQLRDVYSAIIANTLAQPMVFVHRDWHSRNLMVLPADSPLAEKNSGNSLAVIDFQDALYGPVTYDLVSLLRDAYIDWPEDQQIDWAARYWDAARAAGVPVQADFGDFYRDFEWMGLQRQLKVLGIFARLAIRDGKSGYLADMPRVLSYVLSTSRRYREFAPLLSLLQRLDGVTEQSALTF